MKQSSKYSEERKSRTCFKGEEVMSDLLGRTWGHLNGVMKDEHVLGNMHGLGNGGNGSRQKWKTLPGLQALLMAQEKGAFQEEDRIVRALQKATS